MPLSNEFFVPTSCQLATWRITESFNDLRSKLVLSPQLEEELVLRKTEAGKKGFLAVRLALQSMGVSLTDLSFNLQGEPALVNAYCSLSHSQRYAVAVKGDRPIGIDVEAYRKQIVRIAPKFVHPNEQLFLISSQQIIYLTRLWTAKEAVYKAMHHPGLAFASQIEVAPFTMQDSKGTAQVYLANKTHHFSLQFRTFNEHEFTLAQMTTTL